MVTITGGDTYFTNISATFTATKWEACIDQAIDKINGYAREDILPNLGGTVGSKTVSVTSGQAGFIRELTVAIYRRDPQNKGAPNSSFNVGGISESNNSMSSSEIEEIAKNAARNLKELDVSIG